MKLLISDIIKDTVESLRAFGSILSIVDNAGVYTIQSSDSVEKIKVKRVINLLNTPEYTDDYIVTEVNYNLNTFTFVATAGKQILDLGTWLNQYPYFNFGTWRELSKRLTDKNNTYVTQLSKLPTIYLIKSYLSKKINEVTNEVTNLKIYIIDRSDLNKYTQDKIENLMIELFEIKEEFIEALGMNSNIIGDIIPNENDLPFNEEFLKGDQFTKMIELDIKSTQLFTTNTNC